MFEAFPAYDKFRTLVLKVPRQVGEDVFALQSALNHLGYLAGVEDGIFGKMTSDAVTRAQQDGGLTVDGAAGGVTQRYLVLRIAKPYVQLAPLNALKGSMEHESAFRLGIYSAQRPNGSYDAGVAQRNTDLTPPREGFTPHLSIRALAERTRNHMNLFEGIRDPRRQIGLAQGAWNAPAFACYIAREEGATKVTNGMTLRPSTASRLTFENYVTAVSKYL